MAIYLIVINNNLSKDKKMITLLHELAHIKLNQLCQADKNLLEFYREGYEDEADKYLKDILEKI